MAPTGERSLSARLQAKRNSKGYRQGNPDTAVPKPAGCTRILVLGSSTTYSDAGAPSPQDAWPHRLQLTLASEFTGSDEIEVVNAGLNYAMSPELLIHFLLVGLTLEPDIVVWEGPGNDWLPAAVGDTSSDYRETRSPGEFPRPRFGEKTLVRLSGTARLLLGLWLRATRSTGMISLEPRGIDWSSPAVAERISRDPYLPYRNHLTIVAEICTSREIPLLLVPFITGSEKSQSGSRPAPLLAAQAVATNRLNDIMSEVAANATGEVMYLNSAASIPDALFVDGTHLNPEGEEVKARWIANALGPVLEQRL